MIRNLNVKEILAWIVLFCAAFLFCISFAFAQENNRTKKGTASIRIIKKEDGKTTKIDTTIDANDDAAVEKILNDMGIHRDMNFSFTVPEPPAGPGDRHRRMKLHYKGMIKEDRESLQEEMKNLDEEMKDLHEKMKAIHIEIFSGSDGEDDDYSYNFEVPCIPPIPGENDFYFFEDHGNGKSSRHGFSFHGMDTLNDDEHVVIKGDEDEQPPVFEKEVTGKHGEKVFIYKRLKQVNGKSNDDMPDKKNHVKLYPNPTGGKFTLSFQVEKTTDLAIQIYDGQGKQVYSETMNDFSGDYLNRFDLTGKEKGNYILKIIQGDKTSTEKFVIE